MKIAFFGTKAYDKKWFAPLSEQYKQQIKFFNPKLTADTAMLAKGYDAVCAFVNAEIYEETIKVLHQVGVKVILMRCAGYNNVDLDAAKACSIKVLRVPGYSPEAVAEHAMTLAMAANRRIHKAYNKVRDNDFSLNGLSGINLFEKTAGIIGTGKIGQAMIRICKGFGMKVIAYDAFPNKDLDVAYVSLDEVLETADLISLHCPLLETTHHMINQESIAKMKDGVILVNTSRGGLINTTDLIAGIKSEKFHAVALDVYEEESELVFEDYSDDILNQTTTARLLSFPNVILTSHQGFLTMEALITIAEVTLQNAVDYEKGVDLVNEVLE
ncbi:MAG: 2-hydroxyacid dehydrogenase [Lachnospiraceae bacterium]